MAHTHEWVVAAYVVPEGDEQPQRVEVARHPGTGQPFDLSKDSDRKFAEEMGVDTSAEPQPREAKVIFDCSCGETRHVAMTEDGAARVREAGDQGGRIPADELVEAMPS